MFKRLIASFICFTFSLSNLQYVQAQDFSVNQLPIPGTMVGESIAFAPLSLKGLIVNPQKPLEFQFIVDTGKGPQDAASIKEESNQLVKYFLAGLTIPEGDLWVNLSPYEKNRMVPEALGQTDLGRDLLAQDYILKQLTSSLIYPEKDLGREFWSRVYAKAQAQFGTTNIPVNTFNKVWILPDQAQVYENGSAAYVTQASLKVMLDEDYLAMNKHEVNSKCLMVNGQKLNTTNTSTINNSPFTIHQYSSQIVRQIILPEITKEVNTGKNFAPLRQIYQSLILAKWYKQTIQNALLEALYNNKNKVAGVNVHDPQVKEEIYNRYLQAYKKGAFNYIKEDPTPDGQVEPRKYFSGGAYFAGNWKINPNGTGEEVENEKPDGAMSVITVGLLAWGIGGVSIFVGTLTQLIIEGQKANFAKMKLNAILKHNSGNGLELELRKFFIKQDTEILMTLLGIENLNNLTTDLKTKGTLLRLALEIADQREQYSSCYSILSWIKELNIPLTWNYIYVDNGEYVPEGVETGEYYNSGSGNLDVPIRVYEDKWRPNWQKVKRLDAAMFIDGIEQGQFISPETKKILFEKFKITPKWLAEKFRQRMNESGDVKRVFNILGSGINISQWLRQNKRESGYGDFEDKTRKLGLVSGFDSPGLEIQMGEDQNNNSYKLVISNRDADDLVRGYISGDCINPGWQFAKITFNKYFPDHMLKPGFLNFKIYRKTQLAQYEWIGNAYAAIIERNKKAYLLIDAVQIPWEGIDQKSGMEILPLPEGANSRVPFSIGIQEAKSISDMVIKTLSIKYADNYGFAGAYLGFGSNFAPLVEHFYKKYADNYKKLLPPSESIVKGQGGAPDINAANEIKISDSNYLLKLKELKFELIGLNENKLDSFPIAPYAHRGFADISSYTGTHQFSNQTPTSPDAAMNVDQKVANIEEVPLKSDKTRDDILAWRGETDWIYYNSKGAVIGSSPARRYYAGEGWKILPKKWGKGNTIAKPDAAMRTGVVLNGEVSYRKITQFKTFNDGPNSSFDNELDRIRAKVAPQLTFDQWLDSYDKPRLGVRQSAIGLEELRNRFIFQYKANGPKFLVGYYHSGDEESGDMVIVKLDYLPKVIEVWGDMVGRFTGSGQLDIIGSKIRYYAKGEDFSKLKEGGESLLFREIDLTDRAALAVKPRNLGGIDLNQINVLRDGKKVLMHFDPAQLNALEQGGFKGFTPVIISMTPIASPYQLLGINVPKKEMILAKA